MTDQQAAAEKYVEQYEATMTLGWGDDTAYAFAKAVVALSARLAQAEQERDEAQRERDYFASRLGDFSHVAEVDRGRAVEAEARLREYEEALTRLVSLFFDSAPGGANPASVEYAYEQAQDVLTKTASDREQP